VSRPSVGPGGAPWYQRLTTAALTTIGALVRWFVPANVGKVATAGEDGELVAATLENVPDSAARFAMTVDEKAQLDALGEGTGGDGDLIVRMGELEWLVANEIDPSVSGIEAAVGSRCTTVDGLKAWSKYGAGDGEWRSLNETRVTVTAAGGPLTVLDCTVVIAEADEAEIEIAGIGLTDNWLTLRVDGATVASGTTYGWEMGAAATAARAWEGKVGALTAGSVGGGVFKIGRTVGGRRRVSGVTVDGTNDSYSFFFTGTIAAGAIGSIGFVHDSGAKIVDGTTLKARVRKAWAA
jgi:hypothetical protein